MVEKTTDPGMVTDSGELVPWLLATSQDVKDVDIERPIKDLNTDNYYILSKAYSKAANLNNESDMDNLSAESRVFIMLSALLEMHLKPKDRNEPYGPMAVWEGRRTAIPADFCLHIEVIAELADLSNNYFLKARLTDVCWCLDRKRSKYALDAVRSYTDIVSTMISKRTKSDISKIDCIFTHDVADYIRRALIIGRMVGWNKEEVVYACDFVKYLRNISISERMWVPICWYSAIDLDFSISASTDVGKSLEDLLRNSPGCGVHNAVDLWRLAARAYQLARCEKEKNNCLSEAAEVLAVEAEARRESPILAAHFLSEAIAQLHGLPDKKLRRSELRHRLIDIQARIPEEMTVFSNKIDISDLIKETHDVSKGKSLLDKLFIFVTIGSSPDPDALIENAKSEIGKYPLSSIFDSTFMDREGKVIHRTHAISAESEGSIENIEREISQSEAVRRSVFVQSRVQILRQIIVNEHYIYEDLLVEIFKYSIFVPDGLVHTYAKGYVHFFNGDFISAIYIISPILESSLRHVLKINGYDVTIFNDATKTQEDRTISSLFDQMRDELNGIFTSRIVKDIERVFLVKPGPYIRHAVAHGLLQDDDAFGADAIYGCWLIFRLCLMPLLSQQEAMRSIYKDSALCAV